MKAHRTRLALAAVCLLALAGCSDDGDTTGTADGTSASQTATESSGTASDGPAAAAIELVEKSVALGSARVELTVDKNTATAAGVVDLAADMPATDLTVKVPGQADSRAVLVDGKLYLRSPQLHPDKFVELNTSTPETGALGFDPNGVLEQIRQLKGGEEVGKGHYRFTTKQALTFDLHFADNGLLQRTTVAGTSSGTIDVRWSDWGTPVKITAPAAKDMAPPSTQ